MKNYFSILDLSPSLVISTSEVEKAWRALNDSVADSESSETSPEWNGARAVLSDEVRRLEHWLTLKAPNEPADRSINPSLMDLFSAIGPVIASTESVIARQNAATTALAKALLTKEAIGAQLQNSGNAATSGGGEAPTHCRIPFLRGGVSSRQF